MYEAVRSPSLTENLTFFDRVFGPPRDFPQGFPPRSGGTAKRWGSWTSQEHNISSSAMQGKAGRGAFNMASSTILALAEFTKQDRAEVMEARKLSVSSTSGMMIVVSSPLSLSFKTNWVIISICNQRQSTTLILTWKLEHLGTYITHNLCHEQFWDT